MKLLPLIFLYAAVLLFPGCYYDNEEVLYPDSFCDTTNVTFNATVLPLIRSRCATPNCHVTGSQAPDLTQASKILAIANNGDLGTLVLVNKTMPPAGPLPACDRRKVQQWLDAGSPDN